MPTSPGTTAAVRPSAPCSLPRCPTTGSPCGSREGWTATRGCGPASAAWIPLWSCGASEIWPAAGSLQRGTPTRRRFHRGRSSSTISSACAPWPTGSAPTRRGSPIATSLVTITWSRRENRPAMPSGRSASTLRGNAVSSPGLPISLGCSPKSTGHPTRYNRRYRTRLWSSGWSSSSRRPARGKPRRPCGDSPGCTRRVSWTGCTLPCPPALLPSSFTSGSRASRSGCSLATAGPNRCWPCRATSRQARSRVTACRITWSGGTTTRMTAAAGPPRAPSNTWRLRSPWARWTRQ